MKSTNSRLYRLPSGKIVDYNPLPYELAAIAIMLGMISLLIGLLVVLT